ncbi:ABC transporter substrate-binding protein [Bifidobacterium aquikefiri]|uniref:ABC transporter substrate-binding protein n=1 Tax=Bifidobacterium aquikefiri TaxID=1653207 RepID=UPI0039E87164
MIGSNLQKHVTRVVAGLLSAACLVSLAACGPGSSSSGTATAGAVSTDIGSAKYSLTLWDGAGLKTYDDALIKAFEAKYPAITIKPTYDPDNVSQQDGPRIIASADAPDIARVTDINSAVRGKHLTNLDAYAKAYSWNLPKSQTEVYTVNSSGKIGAGSLYAVPSGISMTGMYWNKDVAKKLGINAAPTSMTELESDMAKAKSAGVVPMVMPAKEGGTSYVYQALLVNFAGRKAVQDWIIQTKGATFNTPSAVKAAEKIQSWQNSGYFSSDALALDGSTAEARFAKGQGLFFPAGSWYSAALNEALGSGAGFFAFPGTTADDHASAAANAVSAFGIPANSKNKNVAAKFIDFLTTQTARKIAVDNGYPPIGSQAAPSTSNALLGEVLIAYKGLIETGNTTDFINNATAGMQASAIVPDFQQLLDGSLTPGAFAKAIQAQYEKETN